MLPSGAREPRTDHEANVYMDVPVTNLFPAGTFRGHVTHVKAAGEAKFHFGVTYDDNDYEEYDWNELVAIMDVPPHLPSVEAELDPDGKGGGHKRPMARQQKPTDSGEDDDDQGENEDPSDRAAHRAPRQRAFKKVKAEVGTAPSQRGGHAAGHAERSFGGLNNPRVGLDAAGPSERAPATLAAMDVDTQGRAVARGKAGHLEKIRLENFMCHELFEMKFGANVTLVSGTNGSGKSAVMQGLQVCLGVPARKTGRATSLHQFIKTDRSEARVQVTIFNTGTDAFEPEKFGNRITIERKLARTNGSHWKLFNANMKEVKDIKPADVLRYIGVNACNPLTIITQDMSRSFLSGDKDDKHRKYSMFMEGTYLAEIQQDLAGSSTNVENSKEHLATVKTVFAEKKKEAKDVLDRIEKLRDVDRHIELNKQMELAKVWLPAWKQREALGQKRIGVEVLGPKKLAECEQKVEGLATSFEAVKEEEREQLAIISASNQAAQSAAVDYQRLRAANKACNKERSKVKQQLEAMERELEDLRMQKENFDKVMAEDTTERAQARRQALEELERKMEARRQTLKEADAALDAQRVKVGEARTESDVIKAQLDATNQEVMAHQRQVQDYQTQLRNLKTNQNDRVRLFGGEAVRKLLNLIAQNIRHFDREPIGPIGRYLGLKEAQWATAIEAALGNMLNQFICHSQKDITLLRKLATEAGMRNTSNYQFKFDYPPHRFQPLRVHGKVTIYDVLTIADPAPTQGFDRVTVITNLLLDRAYVEKTVLANSPQEARDVIESRQCSSVYAINGFKGSKTGDTKQFRQYSSNMPPRLGMGDEERVAQIEEAIRILNDQMGAAYANARGLEGRAAELGARAANESKAEVECGRRKKKAKAELDSELAELKRLNDQYAGQESSNPGDHMDELHTQAQTCQGELMDRQAEVDQLVMRLRDADQAEQEAKERLHKFNEINARRGEELDEQSRQLDRISRERAGIQDQLAHHRNELQRVQGRMAQLVEEIEGMAAQLEITEQAARVQSREEDAEKAMVMVKEAQLERLRVYVEKRRAPGHAYAGRSDGEIDEIVQQLLNEGITIEGLDKEAMRLESLISAAERDAGGNRDELEKSHEKMANKLYKLGVLLNTARATNKGMQQALGKRLEDYQRTKDSIVKICSDKFNSMMHARNHMGRLQLDEAKQELTLVVRVKGVIDKNVKQVTDLKQLSGGERSYTTVAFLLALGEYSESPFRCMDEFDVYMDAINRRVATEMLLESAFDHQHFQHIFLTPQDIQTVEDAKKVLGEKLRQKGVEIPAGFLKTVQMRAARP